MENRRLIVVALGLSLFAVLDGLVLGVLAGLLLQPPPSSSLVYDTDEYVALIALAYQNDLNLDTAQDRLVSLQSDPASLPPLLSEVAARRDPQQARAVLALASAFERDQAPQPPVSAPTPVPTFTPTPVVVAANAPVANPPAANVPAPASVQSVATATRAATATRPAAPTPTRTATRPAAPTPTKRPPTATATSAPPGVAPAPGATNTPTTPPPANGVAYRIKLVRRLTACENGGNHHLFMLVVDAQGNGLPNKQVEVIWPSGLTIVTTGQKVETLPSLGINAQNTAGYVNFGMYHGSYRARVLDGVSEQTDWLTVDIPVDEYCPATDNPQGNSLYHYSYLIVFQRTR
ncbi:MAG: hypothetical protein HZB53_11125 [Chloroflexi bacterium]|nr:hypothetical protein [Chloroflexota bacterium]